jgi:hypothetical protein
MASLPFFIFEFLRSKNSKGHRQPASMPAPQGKLAPLYAAVFTAAAAFGWGYCANEAGIYSPWGLIPKNPLTHFAEEALR